MMCNIASRGIARNREAQCIVSAVLRPRSHRHPRGTLLAAIGLTLATTGAEACRRAPAPLTEPPFSVWEVSIPQLQAAMASGRVTSEALVGMYLNRITAYDQGGPILNTMIRLFRLNRPGITEI